MSRYDDEDQNLLYLRDLNFSPKPLNPLNTGAQPNHATQSVKRKPLPSVSGSHYQELSPIRADQHVLFLQHWWLEVVICLLMVSMLFAIVGILYPHQGNPLPQWPLHISINTVVSIFATILKIGMLFILSQGLSQLKWQWFVHSRPLQDLAWFDAASRGPWGCLQLLFGLKALHPIASCGAILVILSIALDPFIQQLIHYVDCQQVKLDSAATLPRSSLYSEAGAHTGAGIWPPATPILAYVNQGIYSPADVQTPFSCSTGNCTFQDQFRTLGYCATCEDLTQELKVRQINVTTYYNTSQGLQTDTSPFINTTLPSGTYASYQRNGDESQTWFTMNSTGSWIEIVLAASSVPGDNATAGDSHHISSLLRGGNPTTSGYINAYDNNTWACSDTAAGAARCRLDPCVRTYRGNVSYGRLQEETIDTNLNMFIGYPYGPFTYTMADLGCAGEDTYKRLQQSGYQIKDPTALIPWNVIIDESNTTTTAYANQSTLPNFAGTLQNNVTIPGPLVDGINLPLDIIPAQCIYQMDWPAVSSLNSYLATTLTGSIRPNNAFEAVDGPTAIRAIFNDSYVSFDSVNFTFQAIAESITLRIRQYGEPLFNQYSQPVTGVTWENATCVNVRWLFLIFPATMTALTVLLLVVVIIKTEVGEAKNTAQGWKASLLPIVFCELVVEASVQNELETIKVGAREMRFRDMDKLATRTRAQLRGESESS